VEEGCRNQLDSEIGNVRDDALTFSRVMYAQIAGRQPFSTTTTLLHDFGETFYQSSTVLPRKRGDR
jgi:hypothetical protein